MRVQLKVLRKIRSECANFAEDDSGVGISDYGAMFALLMMAAGIGAGWYFLSSAPLAPGPSGVSQAPRRATTITEIEFAAPAQGRYISCPGCGGG